MKKQALILLLIILTGAAFVNAFAKVGDIVEQAIEFITTLLGYGAVIALFAAYKGIPLLEKKVLSVIAVFYIFMTVIEAFYPVFIYREQTLPADYFTVFFLQFAMNVYIVKVVLHECSYSSVR
ncbi:hypothetical protein O4N82_23745 [Vibrio parahaemolyticus]|nr:hypothetical protein [Vibrio parahaemolyticus]KAB5596945.1 hypothetical protein F0578_24575 [Vibrio parahaemolyticus]MCZ6382203.1 hypothetical protein [Vibrio parahaemolyticus]MCZ6404719.1 hypothetical protein [Vibrio parahaemolyticus]MQP55202.1 hypothetical protein [Vibrio parahaemolyticus]MQY99471.1 hypothetical protein [Vibrio parahaemolyticus]